MASAARAESYVGAAATTSECAVGTMCAMNGRLMSVPQSTRVVENAAFSSCNPAAMSSGPGMFTGS